MCTSWLSGNKAELDNNLISVQRYLAISNGIYIIAKSLLELTSVSVTVLLENGNISSSKYRLYNSWKTIIIHLKYWKRKTRIIIGKKKYSITNEEITECGGSKDGTIKWLLYYN